MTEDQIKQAIVDSNIVETTADVQPEDIAAAHRVIKRHNLGSVAALMPYLGIIYRPRMGETKEQCVTRIRQWAKSL